VLFEQLLDEEVIDGAKRRRSVHTHAGNRNWVDAILSSDDFINLVSNDGDDNQMPEMSEGYVMNLPASVLYDVQRVVNQSANGRKTAMAPEEIAGILESGGQLEKLMAHELLGLKFAYSHAENRLAVQPIIAEDQERIARNRIPDGVPMGIESCVIDHNVEYPAERLVPGEVMSFIAGLQRPMDDLNLPAPERL
jgi:hypothetical protein